MNKKALVPIAIILAIGLLFADVIYDWLKNIDLPSKNEVFTSSDDNDDRFSKTEYNLPILVKEDFIINEYLWPTGETDDLTTKVENGFYHIEYHPSRVVENAIWKQFIIDEREDFVIETRIRMVEGNNDASYGVLWGADEWNEANIFRLNGLGEFQVFHNDRGKRKVDIDWKDVNEVANSKGDFNVFKLIKKGRNVDFYLNSKKIGQIKYRKLQGKTVSFYFSDRMKLEVDYLYIYQNNTSEINLVKNPYNGFTKENLGQNINGNRSDRAPVISPDGKTLYFIKEGYIDILDENTDIYYSQNIDGIWTKAQNIGPQLNNPGNNSVIMISADGNTIYLSNVYSADGKNIIGGGISVSNRTENGWEIPQEVHIQNYYNDSKYIGETFSSDKNTLIISVERNDTHGDQDLYVCFRDGDGYTEPLNMGSVINSKGVDGTPYLAPDNRTLYFSSDGHPGYGSSDIFVSRRLDDTWIKWSKPENLGPEVNSAAWDAFFTVPADGEYAYIVSNDNSYGEEDIYRIRLPREAKPKPVIIIKGKVINDNNRRPVSAEIVYQDLDENKEVGRAISNPISGEYQIVLPAGVNYGFYAEKEGFYSISNSIDATDLEAYSEVEEDILMSPIETGKSIRLNNLFFDTDKSELKETSIAELDRLIALLNTNPRLTIQIEGHTDNVGSNNYNLNLSKERAESVVNYLISKGIDASRLTSKGFGHTSPVESNETEEGKARNRRVEFRVVSK